jgi:hypothetical protein
MAMAMKANIAQLEKASAIIEELRLRSVGASKMLDRLAEALDIANKWLFGGLFGNFLLLNEFDARQLATHCNAVASDSKSKIEEINRVLSQERPRFEKLKANIKTYLNIDVD